jgi:hypothetical protein
LKEKPALGTDGHLYERAVKPVGRVLAQRYSDEGRIAQEAGVTVAISASSGRSGDSHCKRR